MSTPTWAHTLASLAAAAWFGAHAAACARGDIVLGERGGTVGTAWSGFAGAAGDAAGTDADTTAVGQAGAAAMSGSPGPAPAGASGGTGAQAGAPAPSNPSTAGAAAQNPTVGRPSSGCGKDPALAEPSVTAYGMRADYKVSLPAAYDRTRAYPLILAFHPTGMSVEQFSQTLNLSSVVGAEATVVYANPMTESAAWEFMRDMPIVEALLPKLKSEYCIDEDRVFALGDGSGSLFTNLVGCWKGGDVRAIAPLSGAPRPPGPCNGNTAVWLVQGKGDPTTVGLSRDNRDYWAGHNACDATKPMPVVPAPCEEYADCERGRPVRYCEHDGDRLPSFAVSGAWEFFRSL